MVEVSKDPYLSPCTKLKSKWIKDLNIKPTTLNLIKKKIASTLECIGMGDHFLNRTHVAQILRETSNKWNLLKLKSFCKAKDMINKTKRQPTEWEKIFTNSTSNRGLTSKIYKELKKLVIKRTNNPVKKKKKKKVGGADLNIEISTEKFKMTKRHLMKC